MNINDYPIVTLILLYNTVLASRAGSTRFVFLHDTLASINR